MHSIRGSKQLAIAKARPPLGLAYAASLLRNNGFGVKILDANTLNLSTQAVEAFVEREKPEFALVSSAPMYNWQCPPLELGAVFETINAAKKHAGRVAVCGSHGTVTPSYIFGKSKADFVIRGEPEITALELAKNLASPQKVKGVSFKENSKTKSNKDRAPLRNLDRLPFPAYDLLPMRLYKGGALGGVTPFTGFVASRGCPYKCVFCLNVMWHGIQRTRSNENILEEMGTLKRGFGIRAMVFYDQEFVVGKEKIMQLCNEMSDRGFGFVWQCATRVDSVDRQLLQAMKGAGCRHISYGIESLSEKILRSTGKGINSKAVENAVKLTKEAGIGFSTFMLFGLPYDSPETLRESYLNAKSMGVFFGGDYALPYPGTALYKLAMRQGLVDSMDWGKTPELVGKIGTSLREELPTARDIYLSVFQSVYGKTFYLNPKFYWDNRDWLGWKIGKQVEKLGR